MSNPIPLQHTHVQPTRAAGAPRRQLHERVSRADREDESGGAVINRDNLERERERDLIPNSNERRKENGWFLGGFN